MSTDSFCMDVATRLRAVRKAKGMTLDDVERASEGRLMASVVGHYERGQRSLSLPRLVVLAEFYDVPVLVLLGIEEPAAPGERRLSFDLDALTRVPAPAAPLRSFVRAIAQQRGDYSGRVLTLRRDDLPAVTTLIGADSAAATFDQLDAWGVLTDDSQEGLR